VFGRVGWVFRGIMGKLPNVKKGKEGGGSFVEEREELRVKNIGFSTFFLQNSPLLPTLYGTDSRSSFTN
jgi:hypothetical protein